MSHGTGVGAGLEAFVGPLEPLLALVTLLGNPAVVVLLAAGAYWAGPSLPWVPRALGPPGAVLVLATTVGALALGTGLKEFLAVPRPPGAGATVRVDALVGPLAEAYRWVVTADGFSLPSNHALGATVVYGGLAVLPGPKGRGRRLGLAAGLVGAVALSRLALGVHVLVDVTAGIGVGLALLAVVLVADVGPDGAVAGAVTLGAVGVALAGPVPEAVGYGGALAGAAGAWVLVLDRRSPAPGGPTLALVGAASALPLVAVTEVAETLPAVLLAAVAAGAWVLALPAVADGK